MSTQNYLEFRDLPGELEWKGLRALFQPFGAVKKLYIHPSNRTGRVIFDSKEQVERAHAALNGAPPYYLELSLFTEDKLNYSSNNSSQADVNSQSNCTMNYIDDDDHDDVMADVGPVLVNVNGIQVDTLTADNGEIFVPLSEVKQLGFELFDPHNIPKRLDYDEQLVKEFEIYLKMKARKFMMQRRCTVSEDIIDVTLRKMKKQTFNNIKFTTNATDSRNNSFVQNERKFNGRPFNQYGEKQFDDKMPEMQILDNKPLRKPYANKQADRGQKQFGRDRENASPNNYERRGTSVGRNSFSNAENKAQYSGRNQNKSESNIIKTTPSIEQRNMHSAKRETALPKCETDSVRAVNTTTTINESLLKSGDDDLKIAFRKTEPTYNQISLSLNTEVEVEVTHVDSENKCWVYRKDQIKNVQEICAETNLKANEASAGQPVIGKICAADFDNCWYRVIILNLQPTLKVLYIDFGNKNTEQIKEIRDLPGSITSIPGQAVCVTFENPPSTVLYAGIEMKIMPKTKLKNGTYVVTEVMERKVSPLLKNLNAKPEGIKFTSNSVDLIKNDKQVRETRNSGGHSTGAIPKTSALKNNKQGNDLFTENTPRVLETKKIRRSVIESMDSDGVIECIEVIDNSKFLAFILPNANVDDIELLDEMGKNAEADKSFIANIGDLIAVYHEKESCWVRGLVTNLENGKYTTALIDYAVVIQPNKICALSGKFSNIPEFSCLCTCKPEVMDLVKKFKGIEVPCTMIEPNKFKLQFDNGATCRVDCEKWDPLETSKHEKVIKNLESSTKSTPIFTDPPRIKMLKQGDNVIIVSNTNQKLLVRTKECNTLFKNIALEISKLELHPLKVSPIVNQIVLSTYESGSDLYRCIVKSIDDNLVELDFIDHGYQDLVQVSNLREINESLATKDSTLIPITLKSFEKTEFSEAARKQLEQYCNSNAKFTTEATSEPGVFNLLDSKKKSLSDQLHLFERSRSSTPKMKAPSRSSVITYQKIKDQNLPLGSHQLLFTNTEPINKGRLVFMITDENIKQNFISLTDEINEHITSDDTPYFPKTDEVCLACFEDGWYRAQVTAANETADLFDVYFIDFGNSSRVSAKDIRKMPLKFTKTSPVAVNCVFQELATKEVKGQLLLKLTELLGNDAPHTVDIISKNDAIYTITIPSIVKALKNEGLL